MNHSSDDISESPGPNSGLEREFLRRVGEETRRSFPRPFAEAELVLIDVDPTHVHAFWNIPLAAHEAVRSRPELARAPMILRLFAVDDDRDFTDTEVGGLQGRTYVGVWSDRRRYRATIGLRAADGSLVELASSNVAELPAPGPAPEVASSDAGATGAAAATTPFGSLFDLEAILPMSSFVLACNEVAFEAVAELHIHGRAAPGSTVRLFGRDVPVRPDGSFSLVRVLPNDDTLLSALLAGEKRRSDETGGPA